MVNLSIDNFIAIIEIDRPKQLNALSSKVLNDLEENNFNNIKITK